MALRNCTVFSVPLLAASDSDLQNNLGVNWFAIGIKANSETRDSSAHNVEFSDSGVQITVTFTVKVTESSNKGKNETIVVEEKEVDIEIKSGPKKNSAYPLFSKGYFGGAQFCSR